MKSIERPVGRDDIDRRLDRVLRKSLPQRSLGDLYKALRKKLILVNRHKVSPDYRIQEGDIILFKGILAGEVESDLEEGRMEGANILRNIEILWEDRDLFIVNKPRGRLVHGENGLDEEVRAYLEPSLPPSLSFQPGPLHRLDRNTSGILVFSRSLIGARLFTEGLQKGHFVKLYLALLDGALREEQIWEERLHREGGITRIDQTRGVPAKTAVFPLAHSPHHTLAVMRLYTGRTHQIRAHAAHHRHPLTGDKKYGGRLAGGYHLHAWRLLDNSEPALFPPQTAPLPSRFLSALTEGLPQRNIDSMLAEAARNRF